jgi:hypothetical protein
MADVQRELRDVLQRTTESHGTFAALAAPAAKAPAAKGKGAAKAKAPAAKPAPAASASEPKGVGSAAWISRP